MCHDMKLFAINVFLNVSMLSKSTQKFCWSTATIHTHLVPSFSDALVLLLEILADCLRFTLASLCLVLTRNHLLQLSIRQLILLSGHNQNAFQRSSS